MTPRYLLIVHDALGSDDDFLEKLSVRAGLKLAFLNSRIAAFVNDACRCIHVDDAGCVLGWLFSRNGGPQQLRKLSRSEARTIAASGGQELLQSFWGGFVACISAPQSAKVLRDPSGTFPCYFASAGRSTILASDAELLAKVCSSKEVDFTEIGRQLFRALVPAPATALRGVHELLPGFALTPSRHCKQEPCWSPWDHVSLDRSPLQAAAKALRACVEHCVLSWASTHERLMLNVSGGLDSSIVAACLAAVRRDVICLTMFTNDPGGDERAYARVLCKELRLQLVERPYAFADIDIGKPLAPHLPRPRDRVQALAFERVNLEVASELGAEAFMTGNGGDNVFAYSQSAAPVADCWLSNGASKELFAAAMDVCRHTGCSIMDALRHAWRLVHVAPCYRVRPNPLFLHPELIASLGRDQLGHPWLDAPPDTLPGTAAHIATIVRSQPCIEADRGNALPVLNPLVSQPIIERCIKIPSWRWRAGGVDRSVARRAFADVVPSVVLQRRVKGSPSRFAAELLDHFRAAIRDRLLDGSLAAHRVIDAAALETVLAADRPVDDLQRVRILELVNVEAWVDHWVSKRVPVQGRDPDINSALSDPPPLSVGPRI